MSTDLKQAETSNHEPSGAAVTLEQAATLVRTSTAPKLWRRRRYQLVAGFVAVLIVLGLVANNVVARLYTPEGAVRDYLTALQAGDASAVSNRVIVLSPSQSVAASLTDAAAMRAALATAKPDIRGFDVTTTSPVDSSHANVSVTMDTSAGSKQVQLAVERTSDRRWGFYPIWRVVLTPVLLSITLPTGVGSVAIDGKLVALSPGKSVVAVLPLPHRIAFGETTILAAQSVSVDTFLAGDQAITYNAKFTDAGMAKAKAAVTAFFDDVCAKQAGISSAGTCPQDLGGITYSGQWRLIGDPTHDLAVSSDGQTITAVGHYQMVFAYNEPGFSGPRQVARGGGYAAQLQVSGADLTVLKLAKLDGLPSVQRPAGATDQSAKDLAAKGFAQCASVSAEWVANCPQEAPEAGIDNVHWALTGDPTAGATVSYDGNTGLVTVRGNFSMSVSYTFFGSARNRSSYITAYLASLFWDGRALQLVAIDGA